MRQNGFDFLSCLISGFFVGMRYLPMSSVFSTPPICVDDNSGK